MIENWCSLYPWKNTCFCILISLEKRFVIKFDLAMCVLICSKRDTRTCNDAHYTVVSVVDL